MGNCLSSSSSDHRVQLSAPASSRGILSSPSAMPFLFNDLKNSTRNFGADCLLGEGQYGCVYKGWINEHTLAAARPGRGLAIAVKKLNHLQEHHEWLTKVNFLGQIRHPNIAKLLGFCSEGENRLLVSEFMPKGSLKNLLFGRGPPQESQLDWATRMKVAIGAARGLSFLYKHEEAQQLAMFIGFKASNILLDEEFNAKLSDFDLAARASYHTILPKITPQHMPPEYFDRGMLSAKIDVYSFGVVLLELLSGRREIDHTKALQEQNLVCWVSTFMGNNEKLLGIMDTKLEEQYPQQEALSFLQIALQCLTGGNPKFRPNMVNVLTALEAAVNPNTRYLESCSSMHMSPLKQHSPLN